MLKNIKEDLLKIKIKEAISQETEIIKKRTKWTFQEKKQDLKFLKNSLGASLVAQWLRVRLPMQGTRVRALVWEDPTCRGATGPVSHNY